MGEPDVASVHGPPGATLTYVERTVAPGVVLWERRVRSGDDVRILPDGCLDLLWDGDQLRVAGPDPVARLHRAWPGTVFTALRFAAGWGPAVLGIPADELAGSTVALDALWPSPAGRRLAEQVAADPALALVTWFSGRARRQPVDPLGPRLLAMARSGLPVQESAEQLGLGVRQLHRRSQALFGYGARRLGRVVRLQQVVIGLRQGLPLARIAADGGYSDQAHLTREVRALAGTTPTRLRQESAGG